ncbi:MAG: two-component system response regulator [Rhodobacteraceae bacterium PARR1]|nr:MAG: two-component system response regulator [Rhodobacteraceae bacterium PARR1]
MVQADPEKPRVLVIEDEENIAIALEYILSREGYQVDRWGTGAAAMDHIRATHPDLVLLDVMLPEVSGYEICQETKLDPTLSDVMIVIMTARGSVMERRKSMAFGANGFISKPFDPKELCTKVRQLLEAGA